MSTEVGSLEFYTADCIEWMNAQPANRFDLVFGSPPYSDARTYGIGAQRTCEEWVAWMLDVTEAAARVCKGPAPRGDGVQPGVPAPRIVGSEAI